MASEQRNDLERLLDDGAWAASTELRPKMLLEVTLFVHRKVRLEIRSREAGHNQPHFHITGPDVDLSISIPDLAILESSGKKDSSILPDFLVWAEANIKEICQKWNAMHKVKVAGLAEWQE